MPDPSIFICYTQRDAERARALHQALREAGHDPWCDDIDMRAGDNWDEVIPAALGSAALVVVIISPHWPERHRPGPGHYDREQVALAIELAQRRGVRVVPVLIGEVESDRVPYGLLRVREIRADDQGWAAVATELGRALAAAPTQDESEAARLRTPPAPPMPEQPYPLLKRYQHPGHFAGRDDDIARLVELLSKPAMALVRLHAVSGAGKSSLLEAGLLPALRARGVPVAYLRDPDGGGLVRRALSQLQTPTPTIDDNDAHAIYDGFARVRALAGKPPVVVLDQFEEVFKLRDPAARAMALARVGFALAAARPVDGVGPPVVRWVLAYRDDYHGPVDGWLPSMLDAARAEQWAVDGLSGGFVRDEHCVARMRLEPLGGRCDGHRFEPPDDIADDPIAAAFLAAIRAPRALADAPWTITIADADAERLARHFADARRAQPDDPLAPELQAVLQRLTHRDGERYALSVGEQAEADVAGALRQHLRWSLNEATGHLPSAKAEQTRQATLDALAELTDAGVRRNTATPRALIERRIGAGADAIIARLVAPTVRVLIEERPEGADRAARVYRLSHDRLAAAVEAERTEGVAAAGDRDFLHIADLVRRRTRDFEAEDRQATALDWRSRSRVNSWAEQLIDTPAREVWWRAVQAQARRTLLLAAVIAALLSAATVFGAWLWSDGREQQQITDMLTSGEAAPILRGTAKMVARGDDHAARLSVLPSMGEDDYSKGRVLAHRVLAEVFPAELAPSEECPARLALVRHYVPAAKHPEDFGALLAASDRMKLLDEPECHAASREARQLAMRALHRTFGIPTQEFLDSLGWQPMPPDGAPTIECLIGSAESEPGHQFDEGERTVRISRFEAMATEVTGAQLHEFLSSSGYGSDWAEVGRLPATTIDWYLSAAFAAWVGGRLPTEAEWECMARAGQSTAYWNGNHESDLADVGWYIGNSGGQAQPVGEKAANPWGLHDVHGNVWEWTADWYGAARPVEGAVNPRGATGSDHRVIRGGSFGEVANASRAACRNTTRPETQDGSVGFRVVRTVQSAIH